MAIDPSSLLTHGLRHSPLGPAITRIAAAALQAVAPRALVASRLGLDADTLTVDGHRITIADRAVYTVALGKAAPPMVEGLLDVLGDRLAGGVAVCKHGSGGDNVGPVRVVRGDHPIPDEQSLAAGQAILDLLGGLDPDDIVVVLVSGGGSALVTAPAEGISLADLQRTTEVLLRSGVDIDAFNAVRARLDRLKAGGLVARAAPAQVLGLVLSDVVLGSANADASQPRDAELATVASGPTVPRTEAPEHAVEVLQRIGLDAFPADVVSVLRRSAPPASDRSSAVTVRLGGNDTAVDAAKRAAAAEGFAVEDLPLLQGEARATGVTLGRRLVALRERPGPACAIGGGETTVTVTGAGKGGRNQELALAAVPLAFGLPEATLMTLATDGEDGPTDAAGAVVRGNTLPRALEAGLDPMTSLNQNDAYPFFDALDDLVRCGPTGTNVCDLAFLVVG